MSKETYTKAEVLELMQKALNLGRQGRLFCDHLLNENVEESKNIYKGGIVYSKSEKVIAVAKGREFVLPTVSHGAQPYDNDQYMFRDID